MVAIRKNYHPTFPIDENRSSEGRHDCYSTVSSENGRCWPKIETSGTVNAYLLLRVDIGIRYTEADFTFGLPDYVRYIEEFVISSGFCSIHFTLTLAGT